MVNVFSAVIRNIKHIVIVNPVAVFPVILIFIYMHMVPAIFIPIILIFFPTDAFTFIPVFILYTEWP